MSAAALPTPRQAFRYVFVAVLLTQLAWIIAVPAFRGLDEFDHAYKARAVAGGHLLGSGPVPRPHGDLVVVPRDFVDAATDACESRAYTIRVNCHPVTSVGDGNVTVASTAAKYNPMYYAVVGAVGALFPGTASLLAMRLATALLCALLLGWAAAMTARWASNHWPYLGLAVACTPVLLYSTSIVSPNGVHYAAAVLAWTGLLGLVDERLDQRPGLIAFTTGAVVVLGTHTTGPLWVLLMCLAVLLLAPMRTWRWRMRSRPRAWAAAALVVASAAAASVAWVHYAGANRLGPPDPDLTPLTVHDVFREMQLWVFQSVGAFPMRDEAAAPTTYGLWILVFVAGAVLFFRRASTRQRWVQAGLLVASMLVPLVLTLIAFSSLGLAWQGRYALPLTVGMPLVAGWALSREHVAPRETVTVGVLVLLGIASAFSVVAVTQRESLLAPHPPLTEYIPFGTALAGTLAVMGPLVLLVMLRRRGPARRAGLALDAEPVAAR
jgi:hypothetical protein